MSASRYLLAACAVGAFFISVSFAEIPAGYAGTPYPTGHGPWEIPGRIDFLNYDQGGLNVTFYADDRAGSYYSSAATRTDPGEHPGFYKTYQGPTDNDSITINGVRYRYPRDGRSAPLRGACCKDGANTVDPRGPKGK